MIHGNRAVYTWRIRELFPEKIWEKALKKEKTLKGGGMSVEVRYIQKPWPIIDENKNKNLPTEKFLFLYIEYLI